MYLNLSEFTTLLVILIIDYTPVCTMVDLTILNGKSTKYLSFFLIYIYLLGYLLHTETTLF